MTVPVVSMFAGSLPPHKVSYAEVNETPLSSGGRSYRPGGNQITASFTGINPHFGSGDTLTPLAPIRIRGRTKAKRGPPLSVVVLQARCLQPTI